MHSATERIGAESLTAPLSASAVTADSVDYVFNHFKRELQRAFQRESLASIRDKVIQGEKIVWVFHDDDLLACAVLSILDGAEKCVVVDAVAGRGMDRWIGLFEDLLREYRDIVGADCVRALCRDGAVKKLGDRWQRKATLMELR